MRISEVIEALTHIQRQHGDIEVIDGDTGEWLVFEVTPEDTGVVVIAWPEMMS